MRAEALDIEEEKRFPSVSPARWNHNNSLRETVQNHKTDIKDLFITVTENGSDWTETAFSACGYLTFFLALLRGFDFIFFLAVFSAIFLH
jgi:hypothetical protein